MEQQLLFESKLIFVYSVHCTVTRITKFLIILEF
jgi:hypothetical protein